MDKVSPTGKPLAGTTLLEMEGDLADQMVGGINRFLQRQLKASIDRRARHWKRDFSSHANYVQSIEKNRQHFSKIIGLTDQRPAVQLQVMTDVSGTNAPQAQLAQGRGYQIFAVRWTVIKGVEAEGLLLQPDRHPRADVVALPDCDWTPEMLVGLESGVPSTAQFARRLAENGCRVLVPLLIDRRTTYSGAAWLAMTNQPHREFIYRAAFELGRHIIGYEVQKILAAVDWFQHQQGTKRPIGVIGYGEGALLALYGAAADTRIDATAVCGYFQKRETLWREPIYRNVFGLLDEFGDAELATLVAPRALCIEACQHPQINGPPPGSTPPQGGTPGVLRTPPVGEVEGEFARARRLLTPLRPAPRHTMVKNPGGPPGSQAVLEEFLRGLGIKSRLVRIGPIPRAQLHSPDPQARLARQFAQLLDHTQTLLAAAQFRRKEFWVRNPSRRLDAGKKVMRQDDYLPRVCPGDRAANAATWQRAARWYRRYFWDEIIGRLPKPRMALKPRTRQIYDEAQYRGYEVVLDVYRDVFASGTLLVPKSIKEGEERPLVVCQHGLEGRPRDVADPQVNDPCYNQYACRLAERGFVTYAPQNPYVGENAFRVLERMANPLKRSLFSFIVRQHERALEWLAALAFVDPKRMAFYGLSYGGMTAMRVPALLEQYCLSICSANYNEWAWKAASLTPYSYMFSEEHEMPQFDLANTFNYGEMSWLICPRPFMVERGHRDLVAPDEWVAYEYARTRRHYVLLGLGDRTEIEFFDGGHTINGQGTFRFLERHLKWPRKKSIDTCGDNPILLHSKHGLK